MTDGADGPPEDGRDGVETEPRLETDGREWQFTLEDIEEREAEAEAAADAESERSNAEPIEPGDPSLENTVFVLLGVAFTLFVISRLLVG
jgi:hypothetical protein